MPAKLPANLRQIALFLERLPGIGEKSANRLAFYLLRLPEADLKEFARAVSDLREKTKRCSVCRNVSEEEVCVICRDPKRDFGVITVVEDVLDMLSFETGNIYDGVYHVLHGRIDPLNHIGPDDIFIESLLNRVIDVSKNNNTKVSEIVLATNPDMEGEATAIFIRNQLNDIKKEHDLSFKVSRLAYGMPIDGNLEYADYMTLKKSLEGRIEF